MPTWQICVAVHSAPPGEACTAGASTADLGQEDLCTRVETYKSISIDLQGKQWPNRKNKAILGLLLH